MYVNLLPNSGIRIQYIVVLLIFVIIGGFPLQLLRAQPHANADRYRMMLQSVGRSDTTRNKQQSGYLPEQQSRSDVQEGPVDPKVYVLGAGDQLILTIWGNEFISDDLTVMPEGDVVIPNIGEKPVAGLTISEAEDAIMKIVSPVYRNARVSISLSHMRHFKVYCSGWIEQRTAIIASPTDRISDIIERAGGLSQKGAAYLRRVQVTHSDGTATSVDLYPYYLWGNIASDPHVRDGDVIYASGMNPANTVTIYGEVGTPGEYQYAERDSLSTVLLMAQGLLPSADVDSIEISRFRKDGVTTEIFFCQLYKRLARRQRRL